MRTTREYVATSERATRVAEEREETFFLYDTNLKVGDTFEFDGLTWTVNSVGEIRA